MGKANNCRENFFDPLFLGELKYFNLLGIPWTNSRCAKMLIGEGKIIRRKAIIKLIKVDYETYPLC